MSFINFIKNTCSNLGNNSKPLYPILAISCANGIFRPTFTIMKKGENPESKKYAALREGITEVIAVPSYIICGEIGSKLGAKIAGKAKEIELQKLAQKGEHFAADTMQEMIDVAKKRGSSGLNLICICAAAGLIIPALCSACVTPIMNKIRPQQNDNKTLDIKENTVKPPAMLMQAKPIERPAFKSVSYSGMKVGGV